MRPLLARTAEIADLEAAWARAEEGRPQLVVMWGRRRVGKTFLLAHFARGRRAVFFGATQQAQGVELRRLAEAVRRDLGERAAALAGGGFPNWEAALRFFAALAADEPLAVVLDEVPYLARSTGGFASIVQVVWDHLPPGTKLLLVLNGSAIGVMNDMLGGGGALRGRPTLKVHLQPLDVQGARLFWPEAEPAALIEAYAVCGGYPLHLEAWDAGRSTGDNLLHLAGRAGGILREDAESMLREELAPGGGYPQILAAVGRGATRYAQIAAEAGQRIDHPLQVLEGGGFVERVLPLAVPKGARPSYQITDPYLRFWFQVLYSDLALIDAGQGEAVLQRASPRLQQHLGFVFEATARAHAQHLLQQGKLPAELILGRWWADKPVAVEIDVLGLLGRQTYLVGEAKWRGEALTRTDLERLRQKVAFTPQPVPDPQLVLWGREGVTDEVKRMGAWGFSAGDIVG